jgi:hypothetical protein
MGIILILLLVFLFLSGKSRFVKKWLLLILMISWLPMYLNYSYNNLYGFEDNLKMINQPMSAKQQQRYCAVATNIGSQNFFCGLFPFLDYVFATVEPGSFVKWISNTDSDPYVNYQLKTKFNLVRDIKEADYLILYYAPDRYVFNQDMLYRIDQSGKSEALGKYMIYGFIDSQLAILQKIK